MELSLVNKLKQLPIEPTYVVTEKNADILNGLHLLETNREIKSNKVNDLVKAIQEGLFIPPIIVSAGTFTVIEGARRGTGEADLSPFRRYRIKDWIRARDIMNISVDQFMNRLKRRVDSGRWEEPSEKNWFNSYIEVASLKR